MYDVIVAGAGPTGSTAARILAGLGCRVLVAERFRLPRYKSCSGVLIRKTMNLVQRYFGETVPDFALCTPTDNRGMIFTNDKGKEYRFEQEGLNVWRSAFDQWLALKAGECGAEIRDGVSVVSCEHQADSVTVTLRGETVCTEKARYLLDCEGVTGALKRKLLGGSSDYITTFQTFHRGTIGLDPHYFYAYLQPELSEYDAWFNVKDEQLVLGVSVKDKNNAKDCYNRFLTYMETNHGLHIEEELKAEKWLMPRILPGCPVDYGSGRVLFAGEAAGFLNPMGEGISAGMESGFCAASAIADNLEQPELVCTEYKRLTKELKTYMERQWSFVADIAGTFREMKL